MLQTTGTGQRASARTGRSPTLQKCFDQNKMKSSQQAQTRNLRSPFGLLETDSRNQTFILHCFVIFQNIIKYQCNFNSIDSMIIICGIQAALSLRHARLYFSTIKIGVISKQSVPWRSQSHPWPPPRSTCPSRRSPRPCSRSRAASR